MFEGRVSYLVRWAKSKKLLSGYVQDYNKDKHLRDKLRSCHLKLAEYLLYIHGISVSKFQTYQGDLNYGSELPMLRCNNVALANEMNCSVRTIQNLRSRLKTAGIIQDEVWHGTNACYEIKININIVHISETKDVSNVNYRFNPEFYEVANEQILKNQPKTLRHTVTRTINSKLNKLSGADFSQTVEHQKDTLKKAVEKSGISVEKPEKDVKNQHYSTAQETNYSPETRETRDSSENTPPSCAAPPQSVEIIPNTIDEVIIGIEPKPAKKLKKHVGMILAAAMRDLYQDKDLIDSELERAKARIAEYLTPALPERYESGAYEIMERITLVKRWIERGRKEGKTRYVPIPSIYFDHRNGIGFSRTKAWFKKHQAAKTEIKNAEILTKAIKEYNRASEPGSTTDLVEVYRKISQRLGKRSKELLNRFNQQISIQNAQAS